jgi:hypothetical protein
MTPTEYVGLALAAIQIAQMIRNMAQEKVEQDETLTPEQKKELLARVDAAMLPVTKIE